MSESERFNEFLQAVLMGDADTVKNIVKLAIDDSDYTTIKCKSCGEIVAFENTGSLYVNVALGRGIGVKYLVLKHMGEDPDHNIVLPMQFGIEYPISKTMEKNLRAHCNNGDVNYEEWFPTFVERWRLKAQDIIS